VILSINAHDFFVGRPVHYWIKAFTPFTPNSSLSSVMKQFIKPEKVFSSFDGRVAITFAFICAQKTTWAESLSLPPRRRGETVGWIECDCGQSDQYRKNCGLPSGGSLKKFGKKRIGRAAKSKAGTGPIQNLIFATKVAS
jgi:hypothetical protein